MGVSVDGPRDEQRQAGRILSRALATAAQSIAAGRQALQIGVAARRVIEELGGLPVFRDAGGPDDALIRVNESCINSDQQLRLGDLLSIDVGCRFGGWCADATRTWRVMATGAGRCSLVEHARGTLQRVIDLLGRGDGWQAALETVSGRVSLFGEVRWAELSGHGIGRELHEDPVLSGDMPLAVLRTGRAVAVELVVWGSAGRTDRFRTQAGAARFEETLWLGETGGKILTRD